MSRTLLAARAGLGRTTVHEALRADGNVPSAETVAALATALGLPETRRRELLELRRAAAEPGTVPETAPGRPIRTWDPHVLEVHPAGTTDGSPQTQPGYVRRAHDEVLANAVHAARNGHSRMLVLVGSSSTGKTRACWEAVQPLSDDGWRLWHPVDPTRSEAAIAGIGSVGPRTVVWLNESQHYLGNPKTGEHLAAALHTLLNDPDRAPVLVLGTLWPDYADRYAALPEPDGTDLYSRVRELLAYRTLTVPDAFPNAALAAAAALAGAGDELLAAALTRAAAHGRLAQELAGAPELLRRFEHGTPRTRALLKAAMDARRLGVGLHQPQDFLVTAATGYLDDHEWEELPADWGEAALADTTRRVHGKLAPLRRIDPRRAHRPLGRPVPGTQAGLPEEAGATSSFRLADYLDQHGRAIRWRLCPPASFWWAAYAHLDSPDDLDRLAEAAGDRYRMEWASMLRDRAAHLRAGEAPAGAAQDKEQGGAPQAAGRIATDDPDAVLRPALARLRAQTESWKGAEILYRQAADAGYTASRTELAQLREQHGDLQGAEALVQRAAVAAHGTVVAELTRLGEQGGDTKGTDTLYRQVAEAGYAAALTELARARGQEPDPAVEFARQAVDAGYHAALTEAGRMRELHGDTNGARGLYREVAATGDAAALAELARLDKDTGPQEAVAPPCQLVAAESTLPHPPN
ncbi:hypothetical protein ACFVGM_34755 [Kitasatospora purpeofusca]|uniref:hypothetical protein n=1 Tax=Kitasatospora purpeofusca TaxID=67352 RepID=UPI0036B43F68